MRPLIILGCLGATLDINAQQLDIPHKVVTIPNAAGRRASPAKWERGRLVQIDHATSTVFAFDDQGQVVMSSRIWPANSLQVRLYNMAVSPSGTYAVEGTAISGEGAPTAFIVLIDAAGRTTKVVQTSPAAAFSLRFADDGTLWAVVRVHDDRFEEASDYDMLRHYDASGVLIQTALPRKRFHTKGCPMRLPILTTSGSKIGLYADVAMTWIELSFTGDVLGHWSFPTPDSGQRLQVQNVALTDTGDLLVSASTIGRNTKGKHGVYLFDRGSQTLGAVDSTAVSSLDPVSLMGVDGDSLVTSTSLAPGPLFWTKLR